MIKYLTVPVVVLAMIVLQTSLTDILAAGTIRMELSLVLVLYLGLSLDPIRGGLLAVFCGFIMDTLTGVFPCFYVMFYLVVFAGAKAASFRVYGEGIFFIMSFVFLWSVLEVAAIAFGYWVARSALPSMETIALQVLQAIPLVLISPLCFSLFRKYEELVYAGTAR